MTDKFDGKLAIIDGAGTVFGREVAILLHQRGAILALNDYDNNRSLIETQNLFPKSAVIASSSHPTSSASGAIDWITRLIKLYPTGISYIFNCTGIYSGLEQSSFHYIAKRHLCTLIHVTRATIPHLAPNASYVNISRASGQWLQNHTNVDIDDRATDYAIQHGIIGFSKSMARELQQRMEGVRMNIVVSKYSDETEYKEGEKQKEKERENVAKDLAEATMYLFSEEDINGTIVDLDDEVENQEGVSLYW